MEDNGIEMGPLAYSLWNGQDTKNFSSEVAGSFGSFAGHWAITEDTYQHFGYESGTCIGKIWVDCSEADRANVENAIRELMSSRKHLSISGFGMNVYHFPVIELVVLTVVLLLMQLSLSWILSRNIKKESLINRIRI